jgi:hypothetical protein
MIAPIGAIAAATRSPAPKEGSAAIRRTWRSIAQGPAFIVRARSSQPISTRRSPSKKDAVIGKKMTSTAMTTFELMPKPNHSTSKGASAKTGSA